MGVMGLLFLILIVQSATFCGLAIMPAAEPPSSASPGERVSLVGTAKPQQEQDMEEGEEQSTEAGVALPNMVPF